MNTAIDTIDLAPFFEAEGLVYLGAVSLQAAEPYRRFDDWLQEGRHAGMRFLEKQKPWRVNTDSVLPGARCAMVFALPYDQGDTLAESVPRVAQYARFGDYHQLLWRKGERIVEQLKEAYPAVENETFRVACDSAPLFERDFAARTRQGFIGKNTCYIHPERGSFLLLGEILTSAPLPLTERQAPAPLTRTSEGGCGDCTACQSACPTGALDEAYRIDARRCLAYWTIENRGPIPETFWEGVGRYYFGCDLCQLACPFNTWKKGGTLPEGTPRRELPSLFETATMDEAQYEAWFAGTAMTRARRNGLRRNALIAMTVTANPRLGEALEHARNDAPSPIVETLEQIARYLAERSQ